MCLNKDMSVTCKLTYMISDAEQLYLFFNVFNINFIIVCISFSNVDDVSPIVSEQQTKLCTQEQCGGDDGDGEDDVNGDDVNGDDVNGDDDEDGEDGVGRDNDEAGVEVTVVVDEVVDGADVAVAARSSSPAAK